MGERSMNKYLLLFTGLLATSAQAWDCKYSKDISINQDLSGSDQLSVIAAAGDLKITGKANIDEARVTGRVCASKKEWLDQSEVLTEGGSNAEIVVDLPDIDSSWGLTGNRYVYVDIEIEVPHDIALDVVDSSGDLEIHSTASVSVKDSSGDIAIDDVQGDVVVLDSSGDIELEDINGNVTVESDSSGDIEGSDIKGFVLVEKDSSGDIRFKNVGEDFVVEKDSSGDIVAKTIGGDFRVLKDGSGSISSKDVTGETDIPDKS